MLLVQELNKKSYYAMARRKRIKEIAVKHIVSNINIKDSQICLPCTYKVYAEDDDKVIFGVGLTISKIVFVLPSYDTNANIGYQTLLTLLSEFYEECTGRDMFQDVYVTRLVKCSYRSEHNLYNQAVCSCRNYLRKEVLRLNANVVCFFGNAYDDYVNTSTSNGSTIPNVKVKQLYSPGILYYDDEKLKQKLKEDLLKIVG